MSLSKRSSLVAVAVAVGNSLRRLGVRAVLTGGACASFHSKGAYHSGDLDFVVVGRATATQIDAAMAAVGFARKDNRYVHPRARFFVEFPRGPLAVGAEYRIRPVERRVRGGRVLMLSATDSCRDRLAAFYHWSDRQSLSVAVWIAVRSRVNLGTLRRWSAAEGAAGGFAEFEGELARVRARDRVGSLRRARPARTPRAEPRRLSGKRSG